MSDLTVGWLMAGVCALLAAWPYVINAACGPTGRHRAPRGGARRGR